MVDLSSSKYLGPVAMKHLLSNVVFTDFYTRSLSRFITYLTRSVLNTSLRNLESALLQISTNVLASTSIKDIYYGYTISLWHWKGGMFDTRRTKTEGERRHRFCFDHMADFSEEHTHSKHIDLSAERNFVHDLESLSRSILHHRNHQATFSRLGSSE